MASCLVGGLIAKDYPRALIRTSDPGEATRKKMRERHQILAINDNHALVEGADIVVLAVKPQILESVAKGIAPSLKTNCAVISIAAGVPVRALQRWLGKQTAIIRAMPNTPSLVLAGATGLFANPQVTTNQRKSVDQLFKAVGVVSWLSSEAQIDAVTAVSGSAPAYFFLIFEIMQRIAQELGLSEDAAYDLVLQTARGATKMAATAEVDCAELRRQVTSAGGTTERALQIFDNGGLEDLFRCAMKGAVDRAQEMADDFAK